MNNSPRKMDCWTGLNPPKLVSSDWLHVASSADDPNWLTHFIGGSGGTTSSSRPCELRAGKSRRACREPFLGATLENDAESLSEIVTP